MWNQNTSVDVVLINILWTTCVPRVAQEGFIKQALMPGWRDEKHIFTILPLEKQKAVVAHRLRNDLFERPIKEKQKHFRLYFWKPYFLDITSSLAKRTLSS